MAIKIIGQAGEKDAAKPVKAWPEVSAQAVASLSAITASATATGLTAVAEESRQANIYVIQHFQIENPEDIPNKEVKALREMMVSLEAKFESLPVSQAKKSKTQRCKEEFESNWQDASSTGAKALSIMTWIVCATRALGIKLSIGSIIGIG